MKAVADDRPRYAFETRGLTKAFEIPVLDDLSLAVRPGELLCLLGPNGCGKTTLLRILAGLESPDAGTVLVDNAAASLRSERPAVGIVFQEPRLLPWKTVARTSRSAWRRSACPATVPRGAQPSIWSWPSCTASAVTTRTGSRAGCSNGSASRGRWPSNRRSS